MLNKNQDTLITLTKLQQEFDNTDTERHIMLKSGETTNHTWSKQTLENVLPTPLSNNE